MIKLNAASAKHPGRVRNLNEDEVFEKIIQSSDAESVGLFIVSDGMGGHAGGEIASKWTVNTIVRELQELFIPHNPLQTIHLTTSLPPATTSLAPTRILGPTKVDRMIEHAVKRANEVVLATARHKPAEAADAGATVTLVVVEGNIAHVANVGDSRTYLFRRGRLIPITKDHSLVASLVAAGQLEPDEIYDHPQRSVIFRSLGNKPALTVDLFQKPLLRGDRLLLCSDGLWEMVRDPQISKIVEKAPNPSITCERLIAAANANGGEDNIGVVVIWVE